MTTEQQPAEQPAATDQADQDSPAQEQPAVREADSGDSTTAPAEPSASEPTATAESGPSSGESGTPQRRVRLNPTVAPNLARPIPSLRPSDPPSQSAATAPSTPASVDPQSGPVADSTEIRADDTGQHVDAAQAAEPTQAPDATPAGSAAPERLTPPPTPVELPARNQSLDANLEAELEAALAAGNQAPAAGGIETQGVSGEGAEQPASAATPLTPEMEVRQGSKLTGTVASIHGDDMFLDFGLRMPGVLSRRQFGLRKQPMQGESLEVVVARADENEGLLHVNLPAGTSRVRGEWDALSVDQNVECMVTGTNKGGLEVSIGALRGFMPASQVELGFVPDLNVYIGQRLKARITEVNPKRRKLVLSRRSLLEVEREQSQQELFEKIEPGQQYTGRVRTLKDYGAFVDIGGADGLLHVAQISWSRIHHPSEVLKEGEEIQVQVLSVDRDKKKISLGMRQLTQNPWKVAESRFAQGAKITGKVTRIENFGAFVELDEGVEGLIHISELDHKRVNKVGEVLRVGQEVEVQVLEVDTKRKRVSLSLKALKEKPEDVQEKAESAPIKRQRKVDSLVGGMGQPTGGQLFGDPSKFGR